MQRLIGLPASGTWMRSLDIHPDTEVLAHGDDLGSLQPSLLILIRIHHWLSNAICFTPESGHGSARS